MPQVFKLQERPWIDVNTAVPEQIAEVVICCPTGALHFERLDRGPQEPVPDETIVTPQHTGLLYLRSRIRIFLEDGSERFETRAALCRCGHSASQPFCDDTHLPARFRSDV